MGLIKVNSQYVPKFPYRLYIIDGHNNCCANLCSKQYICAFELAHLGLGLPQPSPNYLQSSMHGFGIDLGFTLSKILKLKECSPSCLDQTLVQDLSYVKLAFQAFIFFNLTRYLGQATTSNREPSVLYMNNYGLMVGLNYKQ